MTSAGVGSGLGHPGAILIRNLLLGVGLTTFAGLSWQIGPERIIAHLEPLGWRFALVFLPYLLVFVCDTVGWRYAFERRPPPDFMRLLAIHIVGKAANIVTPLVPVGGEPLKAYLLTSGGVPFTEGLASAVISRTVATIAHGLFVLAVTGFTVVHLGLHMPLVQAIGAAFVVGVILVGTFLFGQTRGLFASVLNLMQRLRLRLSSWQEGARDLDRRLARYYRQQGGRLGLSLTFHLLSWLAEGGEAYVLLMLLHQPRSLTVALGVAALSSAVRAASFMVPGSLGVQEGGKRLHLRDLRPPARRRDGVQPPAAHPGVGVGGGRGAAGESIEPGTAAAAGRRIRCGALTKFNGSSIQSTREGMSMSQVWKTLLVFVIAVLTSMSFARPALGAGPQARVREILEAVSAVMHDPQLQGAAHEGERKQRVRQIIFDTFAFDEMARIALGSHWTGLTSPQRTEFVGLFGNVFERAYTRLVLRFLPKRETTYGAATSTHPRAVVQTTLIVRKTNEQLPVDYRLIEKEQRWRVYDVVVDGISLASNYRAQFDRIIRSSSYDTLVQKIKAQLAQASS